MHVIEIPLAGLESLLESCADPGPVMPHAALTASIRPSPADVFRAAQECGWLPCEPFLRPVVPVRDESF